VHRIHDHLPVLLLLVLTLACTDESTEVDATSDTSLAEVTPDADTTAAPDLLSDTAPDEDLPGTDADPYSPPDPDVEPPPPALAITRRPAIPRLGAGDQVQLYADLEHADGSITETTAGVDWLILTPDTVAVSVHGLLTALSAGTAAVTARLGDAESSPLGFVVYPRAQVEARALWVTRWDFSDEAGLAAILEAAAGAGFNLIYLQVRGRFDALYPSTREPWAKELSGSLGQDPGWDPLAAGITRAHALGMELHAWFNVFSFWSGGAPPASVGVPHPYTVHPDWTMVDQDLFPMELGAGEYIWASPGIDEVIDWNVAVARELVEGHPEVDGLHLDRIRYPGPGWSYDLDSQVGFEEAQALDPAMSFDDYRRQRVDLQVAELYAMLLEAAPGAVLSAAVAANYDNPWAWPSVSVGREDHFQDSHAWLEAGIVDVICPMAYWAMTEPKGERTDFASLADDWLIAPTWDRHIYMGMNADFADPAELPAQIEYVRALMGPGHAVYAWAALSANGYLDVLSEGAFAQPAVLPWMPWRPTVVQ
jgi:uncharacterized lipoprotein YddW (UPF0748 family)